MNGEFEFPLIKAGCDMMAQDGKRHNHGHFERRTFKQYYYYSGKMMSLEALQLVKLAVI